MLGFSRAGLGLPSVNHCVSKALLFQQLASGARALYVYYCIVVVYIDSLTNKTLLASFHKMVLRENSNEPSKTVLAEVVFVKELASCSEVVHLAPFFPFGPLCFVTPFSPASFLFIPMWHLLASHQATEYLGAFFRREGSDQAKTSSQIHQQT